MIVTCGVDPVGLFCIARRFFVRNDQAKGAILPVEGVSTIDMDIAVLEVEGFGPDVGQLEIPVVAIRWGGVDHKRFVFSQFPLPQPHAYVGVASHDAMFFQVGKMEVIDGCPLQEFNHPVGEPLSAPDGIHG